MTPILAVCCLLVLAALIITILAGMKRAELWIAVLLVCIALLLVWVSQLPMWK